ncbi:CBS domain-containing protein [Gluconacetobacter diazotrophicus]|nr:CBS domain-containing protein [Gluconacetobacter diazotrophicus]
MTSPAVCVESTRSLADAIGLMLTNRVNALPVVTENGLLVGVVTERPDPRNELETRSGHGRLADLFRSSGRQASEYVHSHGRKVFDIMSDQPVSVEPGTVLRDAVEVLLLRNIRHLPVVENNRVVGMVSRTDVLRALLPLIADKTAPSDDQTIRASILKEYQDELRLGVRNIISVEVHDGKVELNGTVTDERMHAAARVAAENVRGVVSVADHITCVEPFEGVTIPPPPL